MQSPLAHRATRVLAIVGISVLTLIVAIVALLQVPAVATWATSRLLALVPLNPGYALEVGRVSGNWFTGLQLEQVRLRRGSRELALIEHVQVLIASRDLPNSWAGRHPSSNSGGQAGRGSFRQPAAISLHPIGLRPFTSSAA